MSDVFEYTDTYEISGRGTVYSGPAPFDMLDRDVIGKTVIVDGQERAILGLESYAMLRGPSKGDSIGLLLAPPKPPDPPTPAKLNTPLQ